MARVDVVEEGVEFPEKRKLDLSSAQPEEKADSDKRQRTEVLAEKNGFVVPPNAAGNVEKSEEDVDGGDASEEKEEYQEDDREYNVEEEEEEEDGDEEFRSVDAKGKGIVVDDKGKGKMVQEDSEDEDSDCQNDDGDDDSSDDSDGDFSDGLDDGDVDDDDDPLAEVDLSNILPSRTRQRRVQPGIHIVNDKDNGASSETPSG